MEHCRYTRWRFVLVLALVLALALALVLALVLVLGLVFGGFGWSWVKCISQIESDTIFGKPKKCSHDMFQLPSRY